MEADPLLSPPAAPAIRRLTIERFRGIKGMVWNPSPGVNVIIGGGDVGKTTVLDAIALVLNPTNSAVLSEADYWMRDVSSEFCIEAVMSLPSVCGISDGRKNIWPWEWDGAEPRLPNLQEEPQAVGHREAVYRLRVRGTSDFDPVFEILQTDGETDYLSASVRRKIGLVRLTGDDRNDRDLRLVQGSALDRLVSDKTLRARLGKALGTCDVHTELSDEAKEALAVLDQHFKNHLLPNGLSLGLIGSQGVSINALIGLLANRDGVNLPLANWGAGTRRLAALETAATHHGGSPIIIVDEVERGLEPYRQRVLVAELQASGSQVFLTTHSAAALGALADASLWHIDGTGFLGGLTSNVAPFLRRDPDAFLSRVTIVAEGPTEVGFVQALIEHALDHNILPYGIWATDAGGNDGALTLLESLSASGLKFAGFVDNEGRHSGRWAKVKMNLGPLLFQWPSGCLEGNIISLLQPENIEEFIADDEGHSGERLRTLAERLEIGKKDFDSIKTAAPDLKALIIEAATGFVPESWRERSRGEQKALRRHSALWFKSAEGGRELFAKTIKFNLWAKFEDQFLPFVNAISECLSSAKIDRTAK
jgi:putative ATP-dependent endonuclease of OLD family